jgi:SNF2 family DNA or RNA helicase
MQIEVRKNGFCIVHDIEQHLIQDAVLGRIGGSVSRYTGWRWLPYLKSKAHEFIFRSTSDKENLQNLIDRRKSAEIVHTEKIESTELYSAVSTIALWPWQVSAVELILRNKIAYISYDVGLGKTLSAITAIVVLRKRQAIKSSLILCPASILYQWKDEILNTIKSEFQPTIEIVRGSKSQREDSWTNEADIYLTTYESFREDQTSHRVAAKDRINLIVLDEAWKVKNYQAQVHEAIRSFVSPKLEYRIALNATPITNNYLDIFGAYAILDPLLFISRKNFLSRYAVYKKIYIRKLHRSIQSLDGYRNTEEIERLVYPSLLRKNSESIGRELPSILVVPYWVELNAKQRKDYDLLKSNMLLNPLEKCTAARLVCLDLAAVVTSAKYLVLLDILKEVLQGRKAVIFSESARYVEVLKSEVGKQGYLALSITGSDSAQDRMVSVDKFNQSSQLLFTTRAGEAGLNLQAADYVINMDLPWTPSSLKQRVGRVRPFLGGSSRAITVINVLTRDTIEERIIEIIRAKRQMISNFFNQPEDDLVGEFNPNNLVKML